MILWEGKMGGDVPLSRHLGFSVHGYGCMRGVYNLASVMAVVAVRRRRATGPASARFQPRRC